eukprot:CAMPEP_0197824882 /NCGR_PEP_ID=MMETSP1437-20131217/2084_1 /TAXON_ID=49252 ORGANISM="Eucampia antarctica, Strain CCMP1452" /NCGR_SAMPLE_ID=MMETSP1437 /ASSEMBLY_ACC=CAM_ASM_001096 /LENGTH=347 /DNA_ID=CAMNT_0043424687 /DNA_START=140 /DNA_END=1183 /DNA_ORIENTATION=-
MEESNMEESWLEESAIILGLLAFWCSLIPILDRFPRSRGKNIVSHGVFVVVMAVLLFFLPAVIQDVVFSSVGILIIGTVIPIYKSIQAVCTIEEDDDTEWLQYWIAYGTFSYATEFMDLIGERFPAVAEHWYEFEFCCTLWMLLPFTDGSTLIYDKLTLPYVAPICRKIKESTEGYIQLLLAVVNGTYLWVVWMTFMTLPEEARRFAVIAVGTIYPLAASVIAVTTQGTGEDDAFWLTYWSCFNILFILMDYLENFIGSINGFYSICMVATVYLFLPMFSGAQAVFRNILVPLSGQYENMLLRDTYLVKRQMESKIPEDMRDRIFSKAAGIFVASPAASTTATKKDD